MITHRGRSATVFLNPTAWARAAVISPDIFKDHAALDPASRCGLVCDPLDWNRYRIGNPESVTLNGDSMTIRLPGDQPAGSILMITQTFHDGWKFYVDGRPRIAQRFLGAFGYVSLNGGEREIVATFRSVTRFAITLVSFVTFLLALVAAGALSHRAIVRGAILPRTT